MTTIQKTAALVATDQMQWVGLMNCIKAQAEEIVIKNIVYRGVER